MASLPYLQQKLKQLEADRDDLLDRIKRTPMREFICRRNELNAEISKLREVIWDLSRLLAYQDVYKVENLIEEWEMEHQGPFDSWRQIPF